MFELTPLSPLPAPCPPSGVVYTGNSSFVTVSWNASVLATMYTVYDNSVTPKVQLCTTAGLSCSLANIASTNLLITASNAAGESETTNVTHGKKLSVHKEDTGKRKHIFIYFWDKLICEIFDPVVVREGRRRRDLSEQMAANGEFVIDHFENLRKLCLRPTIPVWWCL